MRYMKIGMAIILAFGLLASAAWAGETKQVKLGVSGMMCGSCEAKVKKSLEKVEGVKSVDVQWDKGEAVVTADKTVKDEELVKAVKKAGDRFDAKVAEEKK